MPDDLARDQARPEAALTRPRVAARRRLAGRALRTGGLALLLAGLSQLVLHAQSFSHDERFLALLARGAALGWAMVLGWTVLLALRWWLAPASTEKLLDRPAAYGTAVGILLFGLSVTFTNAYFSTLTHPLLAVALAWSGWPIVERLGSGARDMARRLPMVADGWLLAALGTGLIFLQSYRRHLWFGSGGMDLGLFHQSVWLLSRFEAPQNTVMGMHSFADHMEIIDLLVAPVMWVWPDAGALLAVQAAVVGAGAVAVFDLARRRLGSRAAAWALGLVYLLAFDLQQAVMFDWNPTTVGAGLLPWVAWSFERRRPFVFAVTVALVALCKENLVLYALGLSLALALQPGAGHRRRAPLVAAALLAVWFVVEMKLLLPLFRPEGFRHVRFEALGASAGEMAATVLASPLQAFALLFTPGNKVHGLLVPFSTVAFACFLAPRYMLAFAPALLERFWSSHANRWWGFHYGAGIGVLAVLAAVEGLARLQVWSRARGRPELAGMAVVAVLSSCLLVGAAARFGPGPLWVWRQPYYTSREDRRDAEAVLRQVPAAAAVAAQNHLLPHLSARREIYQITPPVEAEYVALDFAQDAWPFQRGYPRRLAAELLGRGYGPVACEGEAVLLCRGAPVVACPALQR